MTATNKRASSNKASNGELDDAPRRGPGRPRDHSRTRFILNATIEIVSLVGFDRLRVQDVAERAGVSLATIYRRWPTKTALVSEAIRTDTGPLSFAQTGDVANDLRDVFAAMAGALADARAARMTLLATQVDEPEIMQAVRDTHLPPIRTHLRALLGQSLGPDHPDLDLLTDIGPAVIWYRRMVHGESDDPTDLARRVTSIILGTRTTGSSDRSEACS